MPPIYSVFDFGGNVCRNGDYMKTKSCAGLEKLKNNINEPKKDKID